MYKSIIAGAAVAFTSLALPPAAHAAAASSTAPAATSAVSPAKQELVQRILQLWHVDAVGESMLERPVAQAIQQARVVLQGRAPDDRREAAMRDIGEDAKKFLADTRPIVENSAHKLLPSTVAPMLAERFSEDELRQIVAMLESPVRRKFESMMPEMQKALGEKIAADTRPVIDPKLTDLTQRIGMRLRTAVTP